MALPLSLGRRDIMTALVGILLAIMLSAIDQTVLTPALASISTDLQALDGLSWIIVAYLVTSTALTPIYGKLSDIYGRGRIMVFAIVLFVGASVLCALSQTLTQLVIARAVQGIGGGGLVVVAQAMMADFVSPRERGKYQAYIASMWAFAGIAGPPVGGLLADHAGWRWIFWINVPFGILAFVACRKAAAKLIPPVRRSVRIDYTGASLLVPCVSALLIWTSQAKSIPWPPLVTAALVAGVVLAAAFIRQEARAEDPLVPPRLFTNRVILFTNVIGFCIAMIQFAGIVLLPVFFQIVRGMPAANSGLMVIPMLCGIPIASFTSGQIMGRTGRYKPIIPSALSLVTLSFVLFSTMDAATPLSAVVIYVGLLGLGLGACFPVLMISTQNAAEARDIGVATSSVTFSRSLGASFGTAAFWAILIGPLSTASMAGEEALFKHGRAGLSQLPAAEQAGLLSSLSAGFHNVFFVGAGIGLATLLFALFLREEPLKTSPMTQLVKTGAA